MTERKARQDGLDAQGGQERKGWHIWVNPSDGRVYRKRDADDLIRAVGLQEEGYYGDSSLTTLRDPVPSQGRHTNRSPFLK